MKLLVTGGAGFIGSNFIHYLLEKYPDYIVINFDKLTYAGNLDNLKDVEKNRNYRFIKGDICSRSQVEEALFQQVDVIVNFAAETHVDRSIESASDFIITDVFGTHVLLEAVRKYNIQRYIQISTDEVYGSIEKGSFTEESPLNPNSPYAASKASADLLVRSYVKTYNVPAIITRTSNNFGPYQYPEKFIPLFITNAIEGLELPLYGDGKNVRDWIFVRDNCAALDKVLHKGLEGEIYNIASGNEKQNIEIARFILSRLGEQENIIKMVKDRPGHDRRYSLNAEKIKKKLGWQSKGEFEGQLAETVEWYVNNQQWWQDIKKKQKDFKEFYAKWYKER